MSILLPSFNKKTIGILGGMGPSASAILYQEIIHVAQTKYHAEQDCDYPPMIIYNLPLVGFDETGFVDPLMVRDQLIEGVKKLEQAGSNFIIIACNTVHYFFPAMQQAVGIPIMSIVGETVKTVTFLHYACVGVLGSASTTRLLVYQQALENGGINVIVPSATEQEIINQVILRVMGGKQSFNDVKLSTDIITHMHDQGAEALILGCTELPLAINQSYTIVPICDTIEIIATAALEFAFMGTY